MIKSVPAKAGGLPRLPSTQRTRHRRPPPQVLRAVDIESQAEKSGPRPRRGRSRRGPGNCRFLHHRKQRLRGRTHLSLRAHGINLSEHVMGVAKQQRRFRVGDGSCPLASGAAYLPRDGSSCSGGAAEPCRLAIGNSGATVRTKISGTRCCDLLAVGHHLHERRWRWIRCEMIQRRFPGQRHQLRSIYHKASISVCA
jgi:hypothetical protein